MHELSFVREALRKMKKMKKKRFLIRIPDYHDTEEFKELLQLFLEEDVDVRIEKVPVEIKCLKCNYSGKVKMPLSPIKIKPICPRCGSSKTEVVRGKEIEVV